MGHDLLVKMAASTVPRKRFETNLFLEIARYSVTRWRADFQIFVLAVQIYCQIYATDVSSKLYERIQIHIDPFADLSNLYDEQSFRFVEYETVFRLFMLGMIVIQTCVPGRALQQKHYVGYHIFRQASQSSFGLCMRIHLVQTERYHSALAFCLSFGSDLLY